MDAYRRVLSIPGTTAVLLLGLLARIPFSTLGLLLTLHVVLTLDRSYFEAGLIVAASTIGTIPVLTVARQTAGPVRAAPSGDPLDRDPAARTDRRVDGPPTRRWC
ncbi:hypothetical protein M3C58_06480 [Brachybacterium muris]|uniref:hypothetical protein n=1 Tax=Brachybacterium muris TaxID=219301 RepID=UPI0019575903|nr:hypothetical protein [Brachybacterium muris]MBM7501430.1 hypothetical protein [Brachybacterium muris]MCT1997843.1 hypothetical protein [Brachybacterium muris]MCT2296276.1 hypothetical protein [Brachybacterium muris]